MKNNIFCIKRLFLLMRRQTLSNIQKYLVGIGSIVGTILLITLLSGIGNPIFHMSSLFPLYIVATLIGGYVFTSSVFSELNSPNRSVAALTLPVSNFERLGNAWLLSAVGYPIISLLGILLVSIFTGLVHGQQSTSNIVSVLFSKSTFELIGVYIITQSVFLFGAIYFRKHNFFKTIGSVLLINFIFQVVLVITIFAMYGGKGTFLGGEDATITPGFEKFLTSTLFSAVKFVFYFVLAPFFWLLTWLGIKEREV
jgi:hypothetical protein